MSMASKVEIRLKERDEARKTALEQKRKERAEETKETETHDYFSSQFSKRKLELEDMLDSTSRVSSDNLKDHFDNMTCSVQSLQKFLSDSALFLPSYSIRTSQQKINELQQKVNRKQDELLPKKKFAFKSRKKTLPESKTTNGTNDTGSRNTDKISGKGFHDGDQVPKAEEYVSYLNKTTSNTVEIKDRQNEVISLQPNEVQGFDINFTNLHSCTVRLFGNPGTVHISNMRESLILCGPVQGSVFIDECSNCKIVTACQQLRVHTTKDTIFFLHVTSRAIIEDSCGLQFTPYNWNYPELSTHFSQSGLSIEVNNWDKVDDFNWLTSKEHSPNWSILPDEKKITSWD